jgi:glucoamylase
MYSLITMFLTGAIGCHPLLAQTTKSFAPGAPGNDAHWPTAAKNGFGTSNYDQREIVDAGFLELVRLGIKAPDDPLVLKSLSVVDKIIKVDTAAGPAWYRYNHDAYGERPDGRPYDGRSGIGRLWTLLTGERGEFAIASGNFGNARSLLQTMTCFANDGLMIPEQIWDRSGSPPVRSGAGTGSATPLAWSMAQFIRLAINLQKKRNIETPALVAVRYLKQPPKTR